MAFPRQPPQSLAAWTWLIVPQGPNPQPNMSPRAFRISRAASADESAGLQAKFIFDPPIDSDELFDALRAEYPSIKTHTERKKRAVLDFLIREREDDLRALDAIVSNEAHPSPAVFPTATSQPTPSASSAGFTPESSVYQPSPVEVAPSAMFTSKPSTSAFQVWDPTSDKPVKLHSRRRMTDQEKEEYRMRRLLGSCDSCKQKRRKCRHFLQSAGPSKQKAKKAKVAKASSSSNTSPSECSPIEFLGQSFGSSAPSGSYGEALSQPEIPFDQTFGFDFPLFETNENYDLDWLNTMDTPAFTNPHPFNNVPVAYPQSTATQGQSYYANTDFFNSPLAATTTSGDWASLHNTSPSLHNTSPSLNATSPSLHQFSPTLTNQPFTDAFDSPFDSFISDGSFTPDTTDATVQSSGARGTHAPSKARLQTITPAYYDSSLSSSPGSQYSPVSRDSTTSQSSSYTPASSPGKQLRSVSQIPGGQPNNVVAQDSVSGNPETSSPYSYIRAVSPSSTFVQSPSNGQSRGLSQSSSPVLSTSIEKPHGVSQSSSLVHAVPGGQDRGVLRSTDLAGLTSNSQSRGVTPSTDLPVLSANGQHRDAVHTSSMGASPSNSPVRSPIQSTSGSLQATALQRVSLEESEGKSHRHRARPTSGVTVTRQQGDDGVTTSVSVSTTPFLTACIAVLLLAVFVLAHLSVGPLALARGSLGRIVGQAVILSMVSSASGPSLFAGGSLAKPLFARMSECLIC